MVIFNDKFDMNICLISGDVKDFDGDFDGEFDGVLMVF